MRVFHINPSIAEQEHVSHFLLCQRGDTMRKIQFALKILFVFVLLTTLTGNSVGAAPPTLPAPPAKWTVMVYMAGDNDVES